MTYLTDKDAIDEIYSILFTNWEAFALGIVGYKPELRWRGQFENSPPVTDKIWGRVSHQTVYQQDAHIVERENKTYETGGLLIIQLFAPIYKPDGWDKLSALADFSRDCYRGAEAPGGAWFRRCRKKELPSTEKFYAINVIVEYEYWTKLN